MSSIIALEDDIKESNRNKALREIPKIIERENVINKLSKRMMHYDFYNQKISQFIKRTYNKSRDTSITWEVILVFTSKSETTFDVEWKYNLSLNEAKDYYFQMEKICASNPKKDLVIISSSELVEAYPNYTWDAKKFIDIYKKHFR